MIWIILAITLLFAILTVLEPNDNERKPYVIITCVGLLALGIASGM